MKSIHRAPHDYDCSVTYGDTICDCDLGDARERWMDLMHLDNDSTREPLTGDLADELTELTTTIAAHDASKVTS